MSGGAFSEARKGELAEFAQQLRDPTLDKEPMKKRELLKKIIGQMTTGIDMSRIFNEMVMSTHTTDIVQKKLIYLYLANYAESNPGQAVMVINTLRKDATDRRQSPMVRGLALRSLCSLRVLDLIEYIIEPLKEGFNDMAAYVRKTAVMGSVKLYHSSAPHFQNNGFERLLQQALRDRDPLVVVDALVALQEVLAPTGGLEVTRNLLIYLMGRLKEFTEWGQCVALELAAQYNPQSMDERFDIMNILDERLQHSNPAVVFAAINVFLHITEGHTDLREQVLERVKVPMVTMMASTSVEMSFAVMRHVHLLAGRHPYLFAPEYRIFFCRYSDPPFVKRLKLDILKELALPETAEVIIAELSEYVTDVDMDTARRSIQTIGKIAVAVQASAAYAVEHLLSFMEMDIAYVVAETVVIMKDLLRKYPEVAPAILSHVPRYVQTVDEPEARASMIWMLGEYGGNMEDVPFLLQDLVDKYETEKPLVKLQLLTSVMRAFFAQPPQCQQMLGQLLQMATADVTNADVHDRALLYYRLLQQNVREAESVVNCPKDVVRRFAEDGADELRDRILSEFNTFSVIYGTPAAQFVLQRAPYTKGLSPVARAFHEAPVDDSYNTYNNSDDEDPRREAFGYMQSPPQATHGDLLGGMAPAVAPAAPALELASQVTMTSSLFQDSWETLPPCATVSVTLLQRPTSQSLEAVFGGQRIFCMAGGTLATEVKGYYYAKDASSGVLILMEVIVSFATMVASCSVRCSNPALAQQFAGRVKSILLS